MFVAEFLKRQMYRILILLLGLMNIPASNALINGKPVEKYLDLVRLIFTDGTMCTGAYLNETSILTAAHCMDGTAKGGVIAAIAKVRPVPVRFIGVGETQHDLHAFAVQEFVNSLFI